MKYEVMKCDVCGAEVYQYSNSWVGIILQYTGSGPDEGFTKGEMDICWICWHKIQNYINGIMIPKE